VPIYVYQCECGNEVEEFRKFSNADSPVECGKCGKGMKRGVALTSGIILKGSGWARDGYSSES